MKKIYRALGPGYPEQESFTDDPEERSDKYPQWWVSLDEDKWIPIDREPEATQEDYDSIEKIFAPRKEGNKTFYHMVFAKRWVIGNWGAKAKELEPLEIK